MQRLIYFMHHEYIRFKFKKYILEKVLLKLYDKLIVCLLFSTIFLVSCKPDEPVPAYGIVPMYGVVPQKNISIHKVNQTTNPLPHEKAVH